MDLALSFVVYYYFPFFYFICTENYMSDETGSYPDSTRDLWLAQYHVAIHLYS